MFLFLKNSLKQLLKEKVQFIVYVFLIVLTVIFTSAFGISATSLRAINKNVSNDFQNYDYSYRYTSSDYSANDTATISPFFAFDTDLITGDNKNYFPSITFGNDGVLKEFNNFVLPSTNNYIKVSADSSIFQDSLNDGRLAINFHFGETERNFSSNKKRNYIPEHKVNDYNEEEKYNVVRTGEFGDFYRFNFLNKSFQNSLIGSLYEKFNFVNIKYSDASNEAIKSAEDIFEYMFYLNNSSLTNVFKNIILDKFFEQNSGNYKLIDQSTTSSDIIKFINGDQSHKINRTNEDILTNGFEGRVGWILDSSDSKKQNTYTLGYAKDVELSEPFDINKESQNELLTTGSYYVKNYEDFDILQKGSNQYGYNGEIYSNRYFFNSYNSLLNDLTNFDSIQLSQTVMWQTGKKYKYVSAFYTKTIKEDGIQKNQGYWYYPDLMNVYSKNTNRDSFLNDNTFVISQGYATKNNLVLGSSYDVTSGISNSTSNNGLILDGTASDSLNIFPTIYDEDILPDMQNQAILYLCNNNFRKFFGSGWQYSSNRWEQDSSNKVSNQSYQDTSRTYLKYKNDKKNMEKDELIYQLYLANNFEKLNDTAKMIQKFKSNQSDNDDYLKTNYSATSIKSYNETSLINLKSNMFDSFAKVFMIVSILFSGIFILVILFVVYNMLNKFLKSQKTQLGNLKALGVRKSKLVFNFSMFMSIPLIVIVPLGWGLSMIMKKIIMNICGNYFNIPDLNNIGWKFFLMEWLLFFLAITLLSLFITYRTIRKEPLKLLGENSEITKIGYLSKLSSKLKTKKFIPKMRLSILSTSLSNLFVYFSVFFVSILILTSSLLIPGTIKKMSNDYYNNINYENAYDYSGVLSNVPTSRYSFFENTFDMNKKDVRKKLEINSSSLNQYIKEDDEKYHSLLNYDSSQYEFWKSKEIVANYFDNQLFSSLLSLNGTNFSVAVIDQLVNNIKMFNDDIVKHNDQDKISPVNIDFVLNEFVGSMLPSLFGEKEIDQSDFDPDNNDENVDSFYAYCIKKIANNIIPSSIKELWSNNDEFKLFPITIGKIGYDSNLDQMVTKSKIFIGDDVDKQLETSILGVDPNSKNQNITLKNYNNFLSYNKDEKTIPVTITRKMALKNYSVGDLISFYKEDNQLYLGDDSDGMVLSKNWWNYGANKEIDNSSVFSNSFDPARLTYLNGSKSDIGYDKVYYYDENSQKYIPYEDIRNITLTIPVSTGNTQLDKSIASVNETYKTIKHKEISKKVIDGIEYYVIKPFDVSSYDAKTGEEIDPISLILGQDTENIKYSWWTLALNGIDADYNDEDGSKIHLTASPILYTNSKPVKSEYKLKIVGIQDIYTDNTFYMNQSYANEILGYSNPEQTTKVAGDDINIWSNYKLTKDADMSEQLRQIIINTKNGDNSLYGMSKSGISQSISSAIYVAKTKEVIGNLVASIYYVMSIFIVIIVISIAVVIYIISSITINKFKTYMVLMRIMGYRMSEINSILLTIFLPITLFAILIPQIIVYFFLTKELPSILIKFDIAVPVNLNIWTIAAVFIVGAIIFSATYIYNIFIIKKTRMSTLTS